MVEPGFVPITRWRTPEAEVGEVRPVSAYGAVARNPDVRGCPTPGAGQRRVRIQRRVSAGSMTSSTSSTVAAVRALPLA